MMNRIYRLVWNATQQAWVVAGEFCRTHKKTKMLFFERYTTRLLRALSGIF
ncbi:TPA: ESPR domain-containing protein, partial [Enterobacter roggenkampii]|nr:ESPR domain-containing protein [Enterobacter roggenkampii]HDR2719061.1 ESPR domain-containing protein [Enterobacter roggenkampii]